MKYAIELTDDQMLLIETADDSEETTYSWEIDASGALHIYRVDSCNQSSKPVFVFSPSHWRTIAMADEEDRGGLMIGIGWEE